MGRKDWGKRLQHVVDQHVVGIQDFEEWEMVRRSTLHPLVNVEKELARSESAVCHWKRDCIQHIVLDLGFASAVQAVHQAPVVVMRLCPLPSAVSMGSRG